MVRKAIPEVTKAFKLLKEVNETAELKNVCKLYDKR
jgi:hypothetical protein